MKRLMLVLAALAIGGFVVLGGCKKDKPADTPVDTPTEESKRDEPKDEPKEEAKEEPKEEAASGDKIGVPECDEYIDKYTKCIEGKVPEASRAMMKKGMETAKDAWKKAAATEAGKAALAAGCKTALEAAKKATAAWKCEW